MKNILIAIVLTPIVATLVGFLFALASLLVFVSGVVVMFMTPINIIKKLNQQDEDRRKLTGEIK